MLDSNIIQSRLAAIKKYITRSFVDKIYKSVGLRNLLIHGYEKVDKSKALSDIASDINQYTEYMKHIQEFMN